MKAIAIASKGVTMVEEEPEYGDAQLMTWNPHAGRTSHGWDDYSRLQNEDLARRERANVAALQEEQRRRLDQHAELNKRPYGKAPDNFWSCATSACWATTAIFVLMLAAIIIVPITNWSGDITTSSVLSMADNSRGHTEYSSYGTRSPLKVIRARGRIILLKNQRSGVFAAVFLG